MCSRLGMSPPFTEAGKTGHATALLSSKVPAFRIYDLRHTWATRAAEAGMDMPTLAALLGQSKLNMVMRYAHPQERHQADAVKRLEAFNAAKEISEAEKKQKAQKQTTPESLPTISPTVGEPQDRTADSPTTVNCCARGTNSVSPACSCNAGAPSALSASGFRFTGRRVM